MQTFIDRLSQFPHRWSGSENNVQALEVIRETFNAYGFTTKLKSFHVPGTLFTRIIISIILLFTIFFLLQDFYLLSLFLYSLLLISLWGELNFSFNLLGIFLPGHKTFNLEARLNPGNGYKKQVIVVAHHDSPKTGLIYHISNRLAPFQAKSPEPFNRMFILPYLSAVLLWFILLLRPISISNWIVIPVSIISIFILIVILVTLLNMIFSKKSPGANDNGSGLLVLMDLARRFAQKISSNISLTLLSTGAEEVGLTGIRRYIKQNPELDKDDILFINLECLGGGELHWSIGEHYFRKVDYPYKGINIIKKMERDNIIPELPKIPLISPTDASLLANNGFNVITLIGLNQGVVPSNYHRIDDTFDRLDQASLNKAAVLIGYTNL